MNTRYTFLFTFFFLASTHLLAQERFDWLDSLMNLYESQDDFNGSILIAQHGEILYSRSIGYADFNSDAKLDMNTPMHLASITKTFTNLGTMILKERGLLDYNDKVNKYLSSLPYDDLTITHLMTSTSGLKRLYNKAANGDDLVTIQEMIDYCANKKPKLSFKPGDEFISSVAGYCLLAGIIEQVSGKTFSQFMDDEIFNPLDMNHTFLLTENNWEIPRAVSHDRSNKEKEWFLGSYNGGIGIYSSPRDLLKWDQALYSDKLVSKETIRQAYQKIQLKDGTFSPMTFGSWMRWKGRENLMFKNGDWVANNSILFRDIDHNTTVIIMNNRQNRISKFDLMDIILPKLGYN